MFFTKEQQEVIRVVMELSAEGMPAVSDSLIGDRLGWIPAKVVRVTAELRALGVFSDRPIGSGLLN